MPEYAKKPAIRFKGFTDDWEQRKLGEHCEMFNGDRSSKYPNAHDIVLDGWGLGEWACESKKRKQDYKRKI